MNDDAAAGSARPGERVLELVAVMDRLRSPGGCPWDARQSHESLVEYLIEEAYETVEAIEEADGVMLREELGDLLLQVVFHARIAQEHAADPWTIDDVADGIITKLIRRHPHVFADAQVETAAQVEANWHAIKAAEKGRESVTDGIPTALPALTHAGKVLSRSASVAELPPLAAERAAEAATQGIDDDDAYGELLLALVAAGRARGFDAETALRKASRRRVEQIRQTEGVTG
jgi:XTP/dITP diphosphohydrolase